MNTCEKYLVFVGAFSLFRVAAYTIFKESVAKVKVDTEQWKKPAIREMAYVFCNMVRALMGYRTIVLLFGLTLSSYDDQKNLCYINTLFDAYFFAMLVNNFFVKKDSVAYVHQNIGPPLMIQSSLLIAGILMTVYS